METFYVSLVSLCIFAAIMRDKILEKAGEMFLSLGFKSVTMDDIASQMGISKKTLYKHFSNKASLVQETILGIQEMAATTISSIKERELNAVAEEFEIKKIFKEILKNAKNSPMFQLRKYYPEIADKLKEREINVFKNCNRDNLEKGIAQGFYRGDIDIEITMHFYFTLIFGVLESDLFDGEINKLMDAEYKVLEYHIRSIATTKGLKELQNQLNNIKQNY